MPTISQIQASLQAKTSSVCQLVQQYLHNIEQHKKLNAYVQVFAKEALAKAAEQDAKLAAGQTLGRLHGIVIAIKDVLCYKNHPVSAASNILAGFESQFSATAVQRLLAEDAIIIGTLNCDEFAMGSTNENSAYGPTLNAYDTTKVPGGSSGASAVAVQANLCHAALGTDTGGSVRQPAAFCNVIGIKPSYGRISRHGLIAYASSFDQIGTLTHNIPDAALLLAIMAGKDHFDNTVAQLPVPFYPNYLHDKTPKRIAYFPETLAHPGLDPEIKAQIEQTLQQLQAAGHQVTAVNFPYLDQIVATYYILTTAEASSNLARYDGIHYGYRATNAKNLEETYKNSRTQGFGKEVKRRIMLGTFVLSAGYFDAYYGKAQKVRRLIYERTQTILQAYDFIITPTTPTTAFNLGEAATQNPVSVYLGDIFTVQANLAGIPAAALPLYKHSNGMPFGLQVMSGKFEETKLLAFADMLMQQFNTQNS